MPTAHCVIEMVHYSPICLWSVSLRITLHWLPCTDVCISPHSSHKSKRAPSWQWASARCAARAGPRFYSTTPAPFLAYFLCSGGVLSHGDWQNVPMMLIDPSQRCKGGARKWQCTCASNGGQEGKEHWAITGCWRETFWRMVGVEGHSSRGGQPNKNLGGQAWDFGDWKESEECPPVHEVENIYLHRDSTVTTSFSPGLRRQPHPSSPLCSHTQEKFGNKLVLVFGLDNEPLTRVKAPKCQKCLCPHAYSSYLHALRRDQDRQRPWRGLASPSMG